MFNSYVKLPEANPKSSGHLTIPKMLWQRWVRYPLTRLYNSQEKHIKQPMKPTIKLQETIHKPTTYKGWHMLA